MGERPRSGDDTDGRSPLPALEAVVWFRGNCRNHAGQAPDQEASND